MRTQQALRTLIAITALAMPAHLPAQDTNHLPTIVPNLARTEGVDTASGIAYTRLYVSSSPAPDTTTLDLTQPTLVAQCTHRPSGKSFFELFVNFGLTPTDTVFHRPWTPADGGLFPPATDKVILIMDFLGYTKVKPFKRQWERSPSGQLRYNPPGGGSSNMEDVAYFFQYLRSLPTLRLTATATPQASLPPLSRRNSTKNRSAPPAAFERCKPPTHTARCATLSR